MHERHNYLNWGTVEIGSVPQNYENRLSPNVVTMLYYYLLYPLHHGGRIMTDCQNDFTYPSHPRQNRSSGDEAEPNPAAAAAPPRRRGRPPSSGHRGRGRGRGRGSSSSSGSGFVNTYKLPEEVAKRANLPPPPNSDVVQANAALKVPRGERKRVDSREWW